MSDLQQLLRFSRFMANFSYEKFNENPTFHMKRFKDRGFLGFYIFL